MIRQRLTSLSSHHVGAVFDAAPNREKNLAQADSPTNKSTVQTEAPDQSVEEYMQMAARMLYDIIQEWQKRHANERIETTRLNTSNDGRSEP